MLLFHELKKIFTLRRSLVLAVLFAATFMITGLISNFLLPQNKIQITQSQANETRDNFYGLVTSIETFNTNDNAQIQLRLAYQDFLIAHHNFNSEFNRDQWEPLYMQTQSAFNIFHALYSSYVNGYSLFLIKSSDFDSMYNAITTLDALFALSYAEHNQMTITRSQINNAIFSIDIVSVLEEMVPKNLTDEQKNSLLSLSYEIRFDENINPSDFQYMHAYYMTKYIYLRNAVNIKIANNFNGNIREIRQYHGFELHDTTTMNSQVIIARYLIDNERTTMDYSIPFTFNGLINPSTTAASGVTIYDHMFTQLQMATIPLILFACYITFLVFFKDINKGESIISIAIRHSRLRIILAKIFATLLIITLAFFLMLGLYAITGAIVACEFSTTIPHILTTFNGTSVVIMRPYSLFEIYILSLILKLFFFASIVALMCTLIKKTKPLLIIGLTLISFILLANVFLSQFGFYRFVPFLGLDFSSFWGVNSIYSTLPVIFNIWFVLPIILILFVSQFAYIAFRFNKKDF